MSTIEYQVGLMLEDTLAEAEDILGLPVTIQDYRPTLGGPGILSLYFGLANVVLSVERQDTTLQATKDEILKKAKELASSQ